MPLTSYRVYQEAAVRAAGPAETAIKRPRRPRRGVNVSLRDGLCSIVKYCHSYPLQLRLFHSGMSMGLLGQVPLDDQLSDIFKLEGNRRVRGSRYMTYNDVLEASGKAARGAQRP